LGNVKDGKTSRILYMRDANKLNQLFISLRDHCYPLQLLHIIYIYRLWYHLGASYM